MKASKEAIRTARQLLRMSFVDGKLDEGRIKQVVAKIKDKKPRGYVPILQQYTRLIRTEVEKRHAVIESATPLNDKLRDQVIADLKQKIGDEITAEFKTNPDLLGGMRVRLGSDVWDGSVKARLQRLADAL